MRPLVPLIVMAAAMVLPHTRAFGVDQLVVAPEDQACESDAECVIVSTRCSTCECGAPVRTRHARAYAERYRALCEHYHGGVCEYSCPTPFTICRDHRCVLSASPSSNYDTLAQACHTRQSPECCLASVEAMRASQYTLVPREGCPSGYQPNGMRCPDSYHWCQPETIE